MNNITGTHNILIASSYDKMAKSITRALSDGRYRSLEVRHSQATASREIAERDYDVVIINTPLSDGLGVEFAIDISTKYRTGVIVIASSEIAEDIAEKVTDYGIIVIAKPASVKAVSRSTRLLCALLDKVRGADKKIQTLEDKMAQVRIINRAKWKLIEKNNLSEDEAHAYIGKLAMDRCISRGEAAKIILNQDIIK